MTTDDPTPPMSTAGRGAGCLPLLGGALCLLILPSAVLFGQIVNVFNDQSALPAIAMLVSGLALLPAIGLLAWLSRNQRDRAMLLCWLLALPLVPMMVPATLIPPAEAQYASIAQLGLATLYVGLLYVVLRPLRQIPAGARPIGPAAFGAAAVLTAPWALWGAVGSPLDVLLDVATGLLLGRATSLILCCVWLLPRRRATAGYWQDLLTGGFVAGVVLLVLGSNLGFNGGSLVLQFALPPLGWLLIAIANAGSEGNRDAPGRERAITLLAGTAAALPLTFSDIDMLPLISLAQGMETLAWSLLAAAVMGGLGLGLAALIASGRLRPAGSRREPREPGRGTGLRWGLAGAPWLIVGALYLAAGRPGFYGDRLFVVLKDQTDVSAAASSASYDERRRFVYDGLARHAEQTQADLRHALDGAGIHATPYYLVNALEVQADTPVRLWLERRPEVDRVMPSPILRPLPRPLATATGNQPKPRAITWNLQAIEAPRAWSELGVKGRGIVVGQSDSGVEWDHPELRQTYRGLAADGTVTHDYNWLDPWHSSLVPTDPNGHGTHTLGIVLGQTVGVAPEASWIGCRNLLRNIGNPALYLDCLQFMLAPYPAGGDPFRDGDPTRSANVLNNSWGCPTAHEGCDPASLRPAVQALRAAGIFVVASAGNAGPRCSTVTDPIAIYDQVVTVGAIDRSDRVTDFSSVGPVNVDGSGRTKPDIVAPGAGIVSSFPNHSYFMGDGTSQAGPHVAGVVALMWSANPRLIGNVDETERLLLAAATPYTGGVPPNDIPFNGPACGLAVDTNAVPNAVAGFGIVDAYEAVRLAQRWQG